MPRVLDLVQNLPLSCRHVIDLPWRLSSPAINEGRDAAFWEDSDGQVAGLVAWQYYWAVLDFFILPGPEAPVVEADLFTWADERFRERDEERGRPLPYGVEFRDDDPERRSIAEAHGFTLDDDGGYVVLQHALVDLAPVSELPHGFTLRPLRGEQEAAAYAEVHRVAFESDSMTAEWRARTLRMLQYRPELDLVIEAPDRSLAGFCVGWLDPLRRVAQIEPMGIHPRFHRLGLSRVLLLEMLRRFKELGAGLALVETNLGRTAARCAYESVGFQQTHTIARKEKWGNQPA
jgi:mycothiol synthase